MVNKCVTPSNFQAFLTNLIVKYRKIIIENRVLDIHRCLCLVFECTNGYLMQFYLSTGENLQSQALVDNYPEVMTAF
jgi:hypothetical protein